MSDRRLGLVRTPGFSIPDGLGARLPPSTAMTTVDRAGLRAIARECVELVLADFGRELDWSVEVLDEVSRELLADGPLAGDRLDLWWKLTGAYTGEVVVSAFDGEWITHERADGAYAVQALTVTGFPFALAGRVLSGEPYKSFASFARALPAISERDE
jgi:hypothetical protein